MTDVAQAEVPAAGWRLKLGVALLGLSIVVPVLGVPLVAALGLPAGTVATVSGVLLASAEVLGIAAVAVMGKSGYAYIKNRVFGFLRQYGPPAKVSRTRYTIGLVMFVLPFMFGWASPYFGHYIPGLEEHLRIYAIVGDVMLISSLFVLGGDFWEKLRSLFVHKAYAVMPEPEIEQGVKE